MKDGRLGKGYSYFFALIIIGLMFAQMVRTETYFTQKEGLRTKVELVEIPVGLAMIEISIIGALLGISTDGIASKIAEFLGYKNKE
jgi:hypothetical protein